MLRHSFCPRPSRADRRECHLREMVTKKGSALMPQDGNAGRKRCFPACHPPPVLPSCRTLNQSARGGGVLQLCSQASLLKAPSAANLLLRPSAPFRQGAAFTIRPQEACNARFLAPAPGRGDCRSSFFPPLSRRRPCTGTASFLQCRKKEKPLQRIGLQGHNLLYGGPSETRTPNQLIKSQLLYQLS